MRANVKLVSRKNVQPKTVFCNDMEPGKIYKTSDNDTAYYIRIINDYTIAGHSLDIIVQLYSEGIDVIPVETFPSKLKFILCNHAEIKVIDD